MKLDKKIIKKLMKWYQILAFYFERRIVKYLIRPFLPIKPNKIVFDNFCGRGLGDSPMYIAKEIIRQENSFYQFDWCWDKYSGATYAPGECCVKRITMPDGWVREDNMVDDFAPAVTPAPVTP